MIEVAPALEDIARLEQTVQRRSDAWADEEVAWGELRAALDGKDLATTAAALLSRGEDAETARADAAGAFDTLHQACVALTVKLNDAAEALQAIGHDPAVSDWEDDFKSLSILLETTADNAGTAIGSLARKLEQEALAGLEAAEELVLTAVSSFEADIPKSVDKVSEARTDLASAVREIIDRYEREMATDADAVNASARALGVAVMNHQLGHAAGLVQSLIGFRSRLEEAIQSVSALGRELDTLRNGLNGAMADSTQPISDIRSILDELLQRFRSI